MEGDRLKKKKEQNVDGFRFALGDLVDVADDGKVFEGKVWKIATNAVDGRVRYFCKFPGHRNWDEVCVACMFGFPSSHVCETIGKKW